MDKISHSLVIVEWTDSYGVGSNWESLKEIHPHPHHCFSVGWLVVETDDCIVIVPHISPENEKINAKEQGCGDMTIPKTAIIRKKEIGII